MRGHKKESRKEKKFPDKSFGGTLLVFSNEDENVPELLLYGRVTRLHFFLLRVVSFEKSFVKTS